MRKETYYTEYKFWLSLVYLTSFLLGVRYFPERALAPLYEECLEAVSIPCGRREGRGRMGGRGRLGAGVDQCPVGSRREQEVVVGSKG